MITRINEKKKAINNKTGNVGWVIDEYERTTDNKRMVTVKTLSGSKAHWNSKQVTITEW